MNIEKTLTLWIICIGHVEWVYVKLKIWPSSSSQRITGSCKGPRVSFSNNGNLAQRYLGLPYFILCFRTLHLTGDFNMTKFAQCQSETYFRMAHFSEWHTMPIWNMFQNGTSFRTAHFRVAMFQNGTQHMHNSSASYAVDGNVSPVTNISNQ